MKNKLITEIFSQVPTMNKSNRNHDNYVYVGTMLWKKSMQRYLNITVVLHCGQGLRLTISQKQL